MSRCIAHLSDLHFGRIDASLLAPLRAAVRALRPDVVVVSPDAGGIKRAEETWEEVNEWRLALHAEFDRAVERTTLPDRPDYEQANAFLVWARRSMVQDTSTVQGA